MLSLLEQLVASRGTLAALATASDLPICIKAGLSSGIHAYYTTSAGVQQKKVLGS